MYSYFALYSSFFGLLLYLIYWIYFEESLSISKSLPSGKREVVIHEYENEIVGGSDMVKVYYKQEGKTRRVQKVNVSLMESNHQGNYHITWMDENRVTIPMVFKKRMKSNWKI